METFDPPFEWRKGKTYAVLYVSDTRLGSVMNHGEAGWKVVATDAREGRHVLGYAKTEAGARYELERWWRNRSAELIKKRLLT